MESFLNSVKHHADEFKKLKTELVKVVSHLDADGLSSSSIITKALTRAGFKFSLTTVRQLDDFLFDELSRENFSVILFLDLGSGSLKQIEEKFKDRKIYILDHHKPQDYKSKKIILLNPHLHNIDGSKDISGAGVAYLFAKALDPVNMDLAHLAILGAIGDMQENNGFHSDLNNFILEDAVNSKKIEVKIGLRMFGMQTRPINKVLEYTTDPYIPGVTGSEQGAKRFLQEIGLNFVENGKYKKLVQLSEAEMKKLVTSIILKRIGSEEKPEDVLGKIYILTEEEDENPLKDAKEFSTLLNACGRMNKPSIGIGCCLGDKKSKEEAITLLLDYKREIINSLNWFYANKNKFPEGKGYILINAEDHLKDTMIGTLGSMISKSNLYPKDFTILTMAYTIDGNIKASLRTVGRSKKDLRDIINHIVSKVGGIGGGHKYAAGALISQEKEKDFIETSKQVLEKEFIEETIK
ncbi:MAG: DHH family phosphoesterase [Candidatus Woesearchaeota archaeon]